MARCIATPVKPSRGVGADVNWFVLGIGFAYLAGAAYSALAGRWLWALLYALWAIGDFVIVVLEVRSA